MINLELTPEENGLVVQLINTAPISGTCDHVAELAALMQSVRRKCVEGARNMQETPLA